MLSVIWSGAADASDVFYLVAAILAGIATILPLIRHSDAEATLFPAAICFIALGLLAL